MKTNNSILPPKERKKKEKISVEHKSADIYVGRPNKIDGTYKTCTRKKLAQELWQKFLHNF